MNIVTGVIFLLIAALADARAINHATKSWDVNQLVHMEFFLTAVYFLCSIAPFVYSIKFFQRAGISSQTLQSLLWFATTVIFISILDRTILAWSRLDQIIALLSVLSLGTLIYRVS